jgi:hypothetical protein
MVDVLEIARRRRAALDAPLTEFDRRVDADPDLVRFVSAMGAITASSPTTDPGAPAEPAALDAIFSESLLLERLRTRAPEVVAGPLRRDRQHWVGTGRRASGGSLASAHFVEPVAGARPTTKPEAEGLFTSAACLGTLGMWSVYLELHRGSSLHPQPWAHEAVPVAEDADVAEVASAADWTALVSRHPRRWQNLTFPDWRPSRGNTRGSISRRRRSPRRRASTSVCRTAGSPLRSTGTSSRRCG